VCALSRLCLAQATDEPGSRRFPVAFDGDHRHAQNVGHLSFIEAAEEAQLHDTRGTGIDGLEGRKGFVERDDLLLISGGVPSLDGGQGDTLLPAAAFCSHARSGMIDEDSTHGLRGYGKEVHSIVVLDRLVTEQPDAQLVHERVGLERVIVTLRSQETRREPSKVWMDNGKELRARVFVSAPPIAQPRRDLLGERGRLHAHTIIATATAVCLQETMRVDCLANTGSISGRTEPNRLPREWPSDLPQRR